MDLYTAPRSHLTRHQRAAMRKIARQFGGSLHPTAADGGTCIVVTNATVETHARRKLEAAVEAALREAGL